MAEKTKIKGYNNEYHNSSFVSLKGLIAIIFIAALSLGLLIFLVYSLNIRSKSEIEDEKSKEEEESIAKISYDVSALENYDYDSGGIVAAANGKLYCQLKEYDVKDAEALYGEKICDIVEDKLNVTNEDYGEKIIVRDGMTNVEYTDTALYESNIDDNLIFLVNTQTGGGDLLCEANVYDEYRADTFDKAICSERLENVQIYKEERCVYTAKESDKSKLFNSLSYVEQNFNLLINDDVESCSLIFDFGQGLSVTYMAYYDKNADSIFIYNDIDFEFDSSSLLEKDFGAYFISDSDVFKWFGLER